jgi:adenine-specific DNA-methyltransferase
MKKLKLHTPDLTEGNIDRIAALFPNCVTEAMDEAGQLKRAIDFDLLRQELAGDVVEGPQERYRLDWPGKRAALALANAPIDLTLRPCPEESVDFENTQNLYIEGDNLDALKLLQETYLGKVKMIYIDPPYNTGNDFIYDDDFSMSRDDYASSSGAVDEEGNVMFDEEKWKQNSTSNGRFHSEWLSMMYPRLKLARNLLRDDGVVFISIDDGEVSNLRRICDEVFGENQFAAQIIWKKRNTPPNDKVIGTQHDYILVYVKNDLSGLSLRQRSGDQIARYKNPDNHPKGPWAAGDLTANVKGGRYVSSLNFPIRNPRTAEEFYPANNGNWRFNRDKILRLIESDEIYFGKDDRSAPKLKRFLCDVKEGTSWTTLWDFAPLNTSGSNEMLEIFGNSVIFESPKPVGLLNLILQAGTLPQDIILDFFSGSATTAHAVMQLNAEDGGKRRHIMVQLPEPCDEKSEACKAGYQTIAEIGKERIRRAGQKILSEWHARRGTSADHLPLITDHSGGTPPDIGFRVLKIDSSNFRDVQRTPDELDQAELSLHTEHIKPDRTPQDLLFQVLVDWGVDLSLPIREEKIIAESTNSKGKKESKEYTVYWVDENVLAACFDAAVPESLIHSIAARKPLRAVFRDESYDDDSTRINVEQIFKLLSPATEVKSL